MEKVTDIDSYTLCFFLSLLHNLPFQQRAVLSLEASVGTDVALEFITLFCFQYIYFNS